jgi:hypothetical protein
MSANTSKLSIKYHRIGLFGFSHNQEIIASVFPNIKFDFFSKLNGLLQSQNNLNEYDYLILK